MAHLRRFSLLLLVLIGASSLANAADLIPGPLIHYQRVQNCAGADCITTVANVPNQCNPIWIGGTNSSSASIMFSKACSMSAGFWFATRYTDAMCTAGAVDHLYALSSVGPNSQQINFSCEGGSATATQASYIYYAQNPTESDSIVSVFANAVGCQPIYTSSAFSGFYANVTSLCANDDPFFKTRLFKTSTCTGTSADAWIDLSALVSPHNGTITTTTVIDGSNATFKCYGNHPKQDEAKDGYVYIRSSMTSCNSIETTSWFSNSRVGSCVPFITVGSNTTVEHWVRITQQCSTRDHFLNYELYSDSTCTTFYSNRTVVVGEHKCNGGDVLFQSYKCITDISTPPSSNQDLVSFNISSDNGLDFHTYIFANHDECQFAFASDATDLAARYFVRLNNPCVSIPLALTSFSTYNSDDCDTAVDSNIQTIGNLTNALSGNRWLSVSCPNAANGTSSYIAFEILGTDSCVAETPSGIYASIFMPNVATNSQPLKFINSSHTGLQGTITSICYPENEFLTISLTSGSVTTPAPHIIPLGGDRCYTFPGEQSALFFGRAVRARCSGGTPPSTTTALKYALVEQYSSVEDCTASSDGPYVSPYRSLTISQDSSQCSIFPLSTPEGASSTISIADLCYSQDPIIRLKVYNSLGCGVAGTEYAWRTTRNSTAIPPSTYLRSADRSYPPQCNIVTEGGVSYATKVTCFGYNTPSTNTRNTAIISTSTATRIYTNTVAANTCYNSVLSFTEDQLWTANFSHVCSPNDIFARYVSLLGVSCAAVTSTDADTLEIGVTDPHGKAVIECYQSPSATAAHTTDSYVRLYNFGESSCNSMQDYYTMLNVPNVCQANTATSSVMFSDTCYEDDPFISISLYDGPSCATLLNNFTVLQGEMTCNERGDGTAGRVACKSPYGGNRPSPSANQSKISLTFANSLVRNLSVVIDNSAVTNTSCLPAIAYDRGSDYPEYYVKLQDGRCSEEDYVMRISLHNSSTCTDSSPTKLTLYLSSNTSKVANVGADTTYYAQCFTGGQTVAPKSQSVLFRTAQFDNACVTPSRTVIMSAVPNQCAPVESPDGTATGLWVKSTVSCANAPIDANGLRYMRVTYYTTSACSGTAQLPNSAFVYSTYPNETKVCSIDNTFTTYKSSNWYQCLQTRTYSDSATQLCAGTSPGASFTCSNGVWVSSGSVTTPTITIGSGTTVAINGNLNVTSTVTLSGSGSSVTVFGCLYLNGSVVISLTEEDIEKLEALKKYIFITYDDDNCTNSSDLSVVQVTLATSKSCKKVTSSTSDSTKTTLSMTFSIDNTSCGTRWWIILLAVIAAVVVLILIAMLIVTFVPSVRAKVRPFWARSHQRAGVDAK